MQDNIIQYIALDLILQSICQQLKTVRKYARCGYVLYMEEEEVEETARNQIDPPMNL